MKLPGFRWAHSMNSLIRLCLCLVLVSLVTAGAFLYTNRSYTVGMIPGVQVCQAEPLQQNDVDYTPSAIGGNEPVIQVFKAAPMELGAPDSAAVYTFKVKRAKNVQINEAGTSIKNISNPSGATLQGTVTGLPAAAIPTDDSGNFVTVLMASNDYGSVEAELTLSLAQELLPQGPPPESTENQGEARSPQWGDQYSTPRTSTSPTTTRNEPDFFKCPSNCAYCLKPGEAASLGYTQQCSNERCYYSPDDQQNWYCYSEPEGWCCANEQVSQTTKSECARLRGFWSLYQSDAIEACQPKGYCCFNGEVYYPTTRTECLQKGGSYWSTSQAEIMEYCQPPTCWCCVKSQVYEMTPARCAQSGGACYSTKSQADSACRHQDETIYQTPTYR
jgi:hypothetical protein